MEQYSIIKISTPKLANKLNAVLTKISVRFFLELDEMILKFIC